MGDDQRRPSGHENADSLLNQPLGLGVDVGDSENETFWREFLTSLNDRGLAGVRLVVSDAHAGLIKAIRRCFQGAAWQRCRVHAMRNLLSAANHATAK